VWSARAGGERQNATEAEKPSGEWKSLLADGKPIVQLPKRDGKWSSPCVAIGWILGFGFCSRCVASSHLLMAF